MKVPARAAFDAPLLGQPRRTSCASLDGWGCAEVPSAPHEMGDGRMFIDAAVGVAREAQPATRFHVRLATGLFRIVARAGGEVGDAPPIQLQWAAPADR